MLTQERLKELLHYDPDTGVFTRKVRTSNSTNIGDIAGCKDGKGYLLIMIDYKLYKSHRLAWLYVYGQFPIGVIDHINGIKYDNRILNLRDVTIQTNNQNKYKIKRNEPSIPTGVVVVKYKGITYAYRAQWNDIGGIRKRSSYFNFKKCGGEENALKQAINYRESKIKEIIKEGAYYTNRHGQ